MTKWLIAALAGVALAMPAQASELFGGVYAHDVDLPFTKDARESGVDFQLGLRGNRIAGLGPVGGPAPYAFVAVNGGGGASYGAAGLAWKLGGPVFVRPGIGLAVHTGPSYRVGPNGRRTDLGSRVLFEPELAIGWNLAPRLAIEASWVHLSHAKLFSRQNPGIDMFGARLGLHLP